MYWAATAIQLLMMVSASFDWISSTALAVIVCLASFVVFVGFIGFLPSLVFLYWLAFAFLYWYLEGALHGHFLIAWGVSWATRRSAVLSEIREVSPLLGGLKMNDQKDNAIVAMAIARQCFQLLNNHERVAVKILANNILTENPLEPISDERKKELKKTLDDLHALLMVGLD